ncbi:pimeloyl-ACP methyl ester carboxylesterase [Micromonospora pisi]|uniref:Pimeloyl-ACP methyl ester carboxylesterase n=1 Tax=Micromonospora pisi TaxID=589240 RepID=A0A495JEX5_9ACTN|nr:alpha/beta hydrolase [Micromonospora pisi]RKR87403.1 pimeloyl-ACP methyl ester carboxylesterase [Micromonospora pisi]
MPRFPSYDATELTYHVHGAGPPLVCLPGGPGRASSYLDDLGGLSAHRTLIMLDHRGTGDSELPTDPTSYRCDRLVDDVEALRTHLGLDRMSLLGHSAGGDLAQLYAARFPHRLAQLLLITPVSASTGTDRVGMDDALDSRAGEWWYQDARTAWTALVQAMIAGAGPAETAPLLLATAPFFYGRWDERARAHHEAGSWQRSYPASEGFYAGFTPDTVAVRAALGRLDVPVLVLAGAVDPISAPPAAQLIADLFPQAQLVVQDGAGHFPWLDAPATFTRLVHDFLAAPAGTAR